jgi:hypothetical protein
MEAQVADFQDRAKADIARRTQLSARVAELDQLIASAGGVVAQSVVATDVFADAAQLQRLKVCGTLKQGYRCCLL